MSDFFEVVRSQRAHRQLRPDPIPDALIERLLEAAIHAPSAENRQPWVFVVVREAGQRARIAALVQRLWEHGARDLSRPRLSARLFEDVARWATGGLANAPAIIVVCGDTSLSHPEALGASVFPAVQNLLLAAQALGVGSLLSTLPTVGREVGEMLDLPEHVRPMAAVPIGWPAETPRPPRRIPFRQKTFRERYGYPW